LGKAVATDLYRLTADFPADERFGLTSQLRRAAVSIPANVAEGCARESDADFLRFVRIALGSLNEVETLLEIALDLGYLKAEDAQRQLTTLQDLAIRLRNFASKLNSDIQGRRGAQ